MSPIGHQRKAMRLDFGPDYRERGIIAYQPPKIVGPAYPALLPRLDKDGNERGGVRLPAMQVPLATYFGWNRLNPRIAATDENPGNSGSTIPFAFTKEQRQSRGDPRVSIEERFESRDAFADRTEAAARRLASDGFLLDRDIAASRSPQPRVVGLDRREGAVVVHPRAQASRLGSAGFRARDTFRF